MQALRIAGPLCVRAKPARAEDASSVRVERAVSVVGNAPVRSRVGVDGVPGVVADQGCSLRPGSWWNGENAVERQETTRLTREYETASRRDSGQFGWSAAEYGQVLAPMADLIERGRLAWGASWWRSWGASSGLGPAGVCGPSGRPSSRGAGPRGGARARLLGRSDSVAWSVDARAQEPCLVNRLLMGKNTSWRGIPCSGCHEPRRGPAHQRGYREP